MSQQQTIPVSLGFDLLQLQGLRGAVAEKPEVGKTVWQAKTEWERGFRSQAQIRHFTIPMDEPSALGGFDSAPNMVEMVLGAYGCCLTTGYVMNAALQGIELEAVQVDVEGDLDLNGFFGLSTEVSPGYSDVRAIVRLTAPKATTEQLETLHATVTRTSPVGSILERPVRVSTELQRG
jgi:uncharacterized OsmC-like protein